ncbi:FecR/PupR family sigma factor regulator, partial [Pseudomonas taiwanensis]
MSRLPPITEAQSRAALQWLSRINEQPAQAEGAAFKRWLLAEPGHREAYAQAQALWQNSAAPAARLAAEEQASLQRYLDAMARPPTRHPWRQRVAA